MSKCVRGWWNSDGYQVLILAPDEDSMLSLLGICERQSVDWSLKKRKETRISRTLAQRVRVLQIVICMELDTQKF